MHQRKGACAKSKGRRRKKQGGGGGEREQAASGKGMVLCYDPNSLHKTKADFRQSKDPTPKSRFPSKQRPDAEQGSGESDRPCKGRASRTDYVKVGRIGAFLLEVRPDILGVGRDGDFLSGGSARPFPVRRHKLGRRDVFHAGVLAPDYIYNL